MSSVALTFTTHTYYLTLHILPDLITAFAHAGPLSDAERLGLKAWLHLLTQLGDLRNVLTFLESQFLTVRCR